MLKRLALFVMWLGLILDAFGLALRLTDVVSGSEAQAVIIVGAAIALVGAVCAAFAGYLAERRNSRARTL